MSSPHGRYLGQRRGVGRLARSRPTSASDEARAAEQFQRALDALPREGFCSFCGVSVDEAAGKLHGEDCGVAPERRVGPSEDALDFAEEYSRG